MAIPFPEPWLRHPRDRSTLAIYDGARLLTEHGELLRASTWRAFRDAVRDHALTVYVRDLMAPPLDGALDDPDVQVSTNAAGAWQGLTIRAGRRRHHVYASPVA